VESWPQAAVTPCKTCHHFSCALVTAPYTQRKPWYQSAAGRLTNLPFEHYRVPLSPIQVDADEWASLNRQFCLLSLSATPPLRARITLR